MDSITHTDHLKQFPALLMSLPHAHTGIQHRNLNILNRIGFGNKIIGLEYKAYLLISDTRQLLILGFTDIDSIKNI